MHIKGYDRSANAESRVSCETLTWINMRVAWTREYAKKGGVHAHPIYALADSGRCEPDTGT
jgi:hypothetical protein